MTDELIERVALILWYSLYEDDAPTPDNPDWRDLVEATKEALAALKPGDEIGDGLIVADSWDFNGIRRQAAEEMRERCENLCRRRAEEYLRQAQPLSGLPSGQHALDLMGEANQCAVAIRALSVEPDHD